MAYKDTDTQIIEEIRKRYELCVNAENDNRLDSIDDAKFENGEQWDEKSLRDRDQRPNLVINKVQSVVKQIVGDARQNMPRVKIRPVDGKSDPKVAELFNGLIRNIHNNSDAESAFDYGFECAVRQAWGYWRINTKYADDDTFDQDIEIQRIENPYSVYCDPYSKKPNREDAQFWFVSELLSKEEFDKRFPDADSKASGWEAGKGEPGSNTSHWLHDDSIRVAEYWYKKPVQKTLWLLRDGRTIVKDDLEKEERKLLESYVENERKIDTHQICWLKTNGFEILKKETEWAGKYFPIIECAGEEVFVEGKRILRSAIRFAKDPQRLYNWSRSTAVESMALAPKQPWIVTPEAIEGFEQDWQQAHKKPMPYLLRNKGEDAPERQIHAIPDSGAYQEAMAAADDIKATTGIYDASLGARSNETSGVAIMARQREGDNSTYIFHDNLKRAIQFTGKVLVDLIPKIYDTQRVVRLLNEDGTEAWETINILDPLTGKVIANDVSLGKFDVVADVGPAYMTKRIEAANSMLQFIQMFPPAAPVIGHRLAQNMDWPEAPEIAQELRALAQPPAPPQPSPIEMMDMQKKQLDMQGKELTNRGTELLNAQREFDLQEDLNQKVRDGIARDTILRGGLNV